MSVEQDHKLNSSQPQERAAQSSKAKQSPQQRAVSALKSLVDLARGTAPKAKKAKKTTAKKMKAVKKSPSLALTQDAVKAVAKPVKKSCQEKDCRQENS